jgi:hypothetical protein
MTAYMKYQSRPKEPSEDDPLGLLGEVILGYESTLHAALVAKAYNSQINDSEDWALLIANQDELPVDSFVTLGIHFMVIV